MNALEMLVKAIVKRQIHKYGDTQTEAKIFALGYLTEFVNDKLIDKCNEKEKNRIREEILMRLSVVLDDN